MLEVNENILVEVIESTKFLKVDQATLIAVLNQFDYQKGVYDEEGDKLMEQIKLTHPDWEYDLITTVEYLYNKCIGYIFDLDNFK